jgi:uncharacterized protein (TIGR00296 family)
LKLISMDDGIFLVRLARRTVENYVRFGVTIRPPEDTPRELFEKRGVFVTLKTYPDGKLRGCIGFPEPVMPLVDATIGAAISAASRDPRFLPVSLGELNSITVELTVLTKPEPIDLPPEELPDAIKIGRDGLIVRCGFSSGLLLPQVPVEWHWDERKFLSQTCVKAGLSPDCWLDESCKFYRFQGQIFREESPNGTVVTNSSEG